MLGFSSGIGCPGSATSRTQPFSPASGAATDGAAGSTGPAASPAASDGRQDGRAEGPHCSHEPVAASASGSDIAACVDSSGPQPNCSIHASGMVGTS